MWAIIAGFLGKIKLQQIVWIVLIVVSIFCLFLVRTAVVRSKVNAQLSSTISTLQIGLKQVKTNSGALAVQVGTLQLEKKQIKEFYEDEVMKNLKDLNIRLNRMESFSATNTESTHNVTTTLRDSVILIDSKMQPIKYLDYKSKWLDFSQVQVGDLVRTTIVKRDSIIQVVYRPKKEGFFLLRIFKERPPLEQVIKSADPNTIIKYNKYIKPIKK